VRIKTSARLPVVQDDSYRGSGRVLVLGLGNILCKDEGIGARIAQKLQEMTLPWNIEVMDGGTAGLDVLLSVIDVDKLVVIDALRAGKKPGTIYKACLKIDEKDKITQIFGQEEHLKMSLHQVGLFEAFGIAEKIGCAPREIVIIGVEPGEIDYGLELTEQVRQKLPKIIEKVLEEIRQKTEDRRQKSEDKGQKTGDK